MAVRNPRTRGALLFRRRCRALHPVAVLPGLHPCPLHSRHTSYPAGSAPSLKYLVKFTSAGRHYVWFGWSSSPNNGHHIHFSLDNSPALEANAITQGACGTNTCWGSTSATTGLPAYLDVADAGYHTVNVWMDEDDVTF